MDGKVVIVQVTISTYYIIPFFSQQFCTFDSEELPCQILCYCLLYLVAGICAFIQTDVHTDRWTGSQVSATSSSASNTKGVQVDWINGIFILNETQKEIGKSENIIEE